MQSSLMNIFHCYSLFTYNLESSDFFVICVFSETNERSKDTSQALNVECWKPYSLYANLLCGFKFEVSIPLEQDSHDHAY